MYHIASRVFKRNLKNIFIRYASTVPRPDNLKITICGAAGHTGQAVSLLLKNYPFIDELALYDICSTKGIAMDLNHVDSKCKVYSYNNKLKEALQNAKIVVILANASRLVTDYETMFKSNAPILCELMTSCTQFCPQALFVIATNPINSMVPLASEILKKYRTYNKNHVFGVTTLDIMRLNTLVAECQGLFPENVHVPVIGGHSRGTVVPLLSRTVPACEFTNEELEIITHWAQDATENVIKDKQCGIPVLSGALAIARFAVALARAMRGEEGIIEYAYVHSNLYPNLNYLSTPIKLGVDGIQKNIGIPNLSEYEKCLLHNAAGILNEEIRYGEEFFCTKRRKKSNVPLECIPSTCI